MTLTNEDLMAISRLLDTKLDEKLDTKLDEKLDARLIPIEKRMDKFDERFELIDNRLDKIDNRLDKIDNRMDKIDNRMDKIDNRMDKIDNRLKRVEIDLLENNVIPRLNTIESCYTSTYDRYKDYVDRMDNAFSDIELLKNVVSDHSEKLQKLA
ncbi:MAG: hypothetical protein NC433_04215 [Clostridiales bacterium]|nr:hypothetical protein [Clostridiales bacterium]